MPMDKPQDHGGGRPNNPYCIYCTRADGNLKPRNVVREKMIHLYMSSEGASRQEAEQHVDEKMSKMPAWKNQMQDLQE
jgi:hypothetical protein